MDRLIDLYKTAFKKYACFEGRACRAEACAFFLTNFIIIFMAYILFWILFFIGMTGLITENTTIGIIVSLLASLVVLFMFVFALITLVPSLSLGARRCHDFNATGLLQFLIIVAGGIFHIVIMCIPGTEGPNQYGQVSEKF